MKYLVIVLFMGIMINQTVFAGSINPAAYRTMQAQSYRRNYRANVNNQVMPYWQAQSNYSTRNRVYQNYAHYDNTIQQYNAHKMYRGSK